MDEVVLCSKCQTPMGKAGFAWSGSKEIQRYRCHTCGTITTKKDGHSDIKQFKASITLDHARYLQLQLRATKANLSVQDYIINQLFREH